MSTLFRLHPIARALAATSCAILAPLALAAAPAAAATEWHIGFADSVALYPGDNTPDGAWYYRDSPDDGKSDSEQPVGRLLRGGAAIATQLTPSDDHKGSFRLAELVAGDVLQVVDQSNGAVYASATFDARPAFDASLCKGVTVATGLKAAGSVVRSAGAFTAYDPTGRPPGDDSYKAEPGRVITGKLTGATNSDAFTATFAKALDEGRIAWARTQATQGDTVVQSTVQRRVGACPPKPTTAATGTTTIKPKPKAKPKPAGPVDVAPPTGTVQRPKALKQLTLSRFLKRGLTFKVRAGEKATLDASIVLSAKLGPTASGNSTRAAATTKIKLATTQVKLIAGALTPVKLKLTKSGRAQIRKRKWPKSAKIVASFTLTDETGNRTTLPPVTIRLPRS